MLFDFHTHTFLSDGVLSPIELMRRAASNGYTAMAVTDHAGINDQERVLDILVKECAEATENMGITVVPGVELTHVPPHRIAEAARRGEGERGENRIGARRDHQGASGHGHESRRAGVPRCRYSCAPRHDH